MDVCLLPTVLGISIQPYLRLRAFVIVKESSKMNKTVDPYFRSTLLLIHFTKMTNFNRQTLNPQTFKLGGGLKRFFMFTPSPGEMIQFDEHIFEMGWFNHQLVKLWSLSGIPTRFEPSIFWKKPRRGELVFAAMFEKPRPRGWDSEIFRFAWQSMLGEGNWFLFCLVDIHGGYPPKKLT